MTFCKIKHIVSELIQTENLFIRAYLLEQLENNLKEYVKIEKGKL